jgi:3-oxoacyl-[acyl-carrier-protein] synthase-1
VGRVASPLPAIPTALARFDCRNNSLALAALRQIEPAVRAAIGKYGAARVGVVSGTSTSGVGATENAYETWKKDGALPPSFAYDQHEIGGLAAFVAAILDLKGPAYSLSTACSSGAKALASARALIRMGACDAVVVGGADSLCRLTVRGFGALESLSEGPCVPLSGKRTGLNIGEGAAFFLMERGDKGVAFLGSGESVDAHHMSAPDPEGRGAEEAMRAALADAGLTAEDIAYVNLHGTATPLNDRMESLAVSRVLPGVPVSSSKGMIGHTLGAAGAMEAGLCWMALARAQGGRAPLLPHAWDGAADPELPKLRLAAAGDVTAKRDPLVFLSNSFAFGGNNCAVALGRVG